MKIKLIVIGLVWLLGSLSIQAQKQTTPRTVQFANLSDYVNDWDNRRDGERLIVYEVKLLWNNKLARSIRFTVGPNGKIENGIASLANKLGTGRVIVPVTIIGDQDGSGTGRWKIEAFYGNPLTGFTAPQ